VLLACGIDFALGCAKTAAALQMPSGAMFAEAARSFASAGSRLSRRAGGEHRAAQSGRADQARALVVAMLLFGGSGAISLMVGFAWLLHAGRTGGSPMLALAILALSLVFDLAALKVRAGGAPGHPRIRLYRAWTAASAEHRAAILGTILCLASVGAAAATGEPRWDALGAFAASAAMLTAALAAGDGIRLLAVRETD
jgi:uncharacterized DUF497 family protein